MKTATSDLIAEFRGTMKRLAAAGLLSFWLAVNPAPASRPRVTRWGGVYYGKKYETFKTTAATLAEAWKGKPATGNLMVMVEHIVEKPRTGKLAIPKGDVDNYVKGPLDVMTQAKTFWQDDDQVIGLVAFKRYAEPGEKPGVKIEWFEV